MSLFIQNQAIVTLRDTRKFAIRPFSTDNENISRVSCSVFSNFLQAHRMKCDLRIFCEQPAWHTILVPSYARRGIRENSLHVRKFSMNENGIKERKRRISRSSSFSLRFRLYHIISITDWPKGGSSFDSFVLMVRKEN